MRIIRRYIPLVICLTIIGCDTPVNPGPGYSDIKISVIPAQQANCECDGAIKYEISNSGSSSGDVSGARLSRLLTDNGDNIKSQPLNITVTAGQTIPLECSIQPDANTDCIESVAFHLDGKTYPAPVEDTARSIVINTVKVQTNPMIGDMRPNDGCLQNCINGRGPCTEFDATTSTDGPLGRSIALLLGNLTPNQTIDISKIKALTTGGGNECNRTDVVLENGIAYNFGDECLIKGSLPGSAGSANVTVPPYFLFEYEKHGAGTFEFRFRKSKAAPMIKFSRADLDQAFSGSFKQLNFHTGHFIMQHESNSCFAIKVND